jgi:hypothetical protein
MFQVDIVFTIAMDADDFIKLIDFSLLRVMSTLGDISQIGDKPKRKMAGVTSLVPCGDETH